jgi:hypothetical protein
VSQKHDLIRLHFDVQCAAACKAANEQQRPVEPGQSSKPWDCARGFSKLQAGILRGSVSLCGQFRKTDNNPAWGRDVQGVHSFF